MAVEGNGWPEYKREVLKSIHDLESKFDKFSEKFDEKISDLSGRMTEVEVSLKLKAGFWGVVGGSIPLLAMALIYLLTRGGTK